MQTALSQRADFMVFCSVKGGGTESSGRYAFPGGVPEVIPPPSLFYSLRITHLTTFFFFKGASVISTPDVSNHIIEICLKH